MHHLLTHTRVAAPVSSSPVCHSVQGKVYIRMYTSHTRLVQKQVKGCVWSPVNLHLSQSDLGDSSCTYVPTCSSAFCSAYVRI